MQAELEDTEGGLLSLILMRDSETGEINWQAITIIYAMPSLIIISIIFVLCCKTKKNEESISEDQPSLPPT